MDLGFIKKLREINLNEFEEYKTKHDDRIARLRLAQIFELRAKRTDFFIFISRLVSTKILVSTYSIKRFGKL